jgi:RNA polymerase sigma-70 factor (ECF subfamily)
VWTSFSDSLDRYIKRRVADEQTAEDLLQEAFLRIYTHLDSLHQPEQLQGWIYRIAHNVIVDYYRARKTMLDIGDDLAAPADPAFEEDTSARLAQSLRRMIDCLPSDYREALVLTEYEGLSQQELADRTGLSLSGSKTRVQRARKLLREALMACCHFEFDRRGMVINYYPHPRACCTAAEC